MSNEYRDIMRGAFLDEMANIYGYEGMEKDAFMAQVLGAGRAIGGLARVGKNFAGKGMEAAMTARKAGGGVGAAMSAGRTAMSGMGTAMKTTASRGWNLGFRRGSALAGAANKAGHTGYLGSNFAAMKNVASKAMVPKVPRPPIA